MGHPLGMRGGASRHDGEAYRNHFDWLLYTHRGVIRTAAPCHWPNQEEEADRNGLQSALTNKNNEKAYFSWKQKIRIPNSNILNLKSQTQYFKMTISKLELQGHQLKLIGGKELDGIIGGCSYRIHRGILHVIKVLLISSRGLSSQATRRNCGRLNLYDLRCYSSALQ